jgi:hypothetical protein
MGHNCPERGHASIEVVASVSQRLVAFSADLKQRIPLKEVKAQRLALRLGQFHQGKVYNLPCGQLFRRSPTMHAEPHFRTSWRRIAFE